MRQPFFGEEIERERDAGRLADAFCALSQLATMAVGICIRRRIENLARKPQHTLRFVRPPSIGYDFLEVGEHLDLREHLGVGGLHGQICFSGFRSSEVERPPTGRSGGAVLDMHIAAACIKSAAQLGGVYLSPSFAARDSRYASIVEVYPIARDTTRKIGL